MRIIDRFPEVQEFLTGCPCPKPGDGVHNWFYRSACGMHRLGLKPDAILQLLIAHSSRPPRPGEIEDAVANSGRNLHGPQDGAERRTPKWPAQNEARIKEIAQAGPDLAVLQAMSPVKWDDQKPHAEDVIDALFPGNSLFCVARTKTSCATMPRASWRGRLAARQFIVPSPMSSRCGMTKSGKISKRSLDNTGPRRFLVIEFDPTEWKNLPESEQARFESEDAYYDAKRDEHAALLWHLARFLPLAMVVHSAGKSLHGWCSCAGRSEADLLRFMRYAVSIGADPATWTKCQFVRMPDGRRDNGKRQKVVFFNPAASNNQ